jgi:hypothetical protein
VVITLNVYPPAQSAVWIWTADLRIQGMTSYRMIYHEVILWVKHAYYPHSQVCDLLQDRPVILSGMTPHDNPVIVYQQLESGHQPQRESVTRQTVWLTVSCKVTHTQVEVNEKLLADSNLDLDTSNCGCSDNSTSMNILVWIKVRLQFHCTETPPPWK